MNSRSQHQTISSESPDRLKILFVTSARVEGPPNQNHFQRLMILSELAELTILAPAGADFSLAKAKGARLIAPSLPGRLGVFGEAIRIGLTGRQRRIFDVILTDPSILGLCGLTLKLTAPKTKWAVDIWDIPIRCQAQRGILKWRTSFIKKIMRIAYGYSDLFVVSILPSLDLKWFALPEAKIKLFSNAIWRNDFQASTQQDLRPVRHKNILCMRSRYTADMGMDTLAQAFNSLILKFPELTLTIVGIMPPEVKEQIESIVALPNVTLLGLLSHHEVFKLISQATVCVVPFKDVPDLAQTCPIKVLEYLSMGKPVIASNIAGLASMIEDGQNGVLFRAGDAQDLADKIAALIKDPKRRERLSRRAEQLDPKHDAHVKGEQVLSALKAIAAN